MEKVSKRKTNTKSTKKVPVINNKIIAKAIYSKGNKTSVSYEQDGKKYAMFVDGIYAGNIVIEYKNNLCIENIVTIKPMV